jgi:opacity protein-like surface antigen
MNQNVTLIAPFQNNYHNNISIFDFVGGLFIGAESQPWHNVFGQLGVSYYNNSSYRIQGVINQFTDPTLNNLRYNYDIQSTRFLVETKILANAAGKYHPFINAGVGTAINNATNYSETPLTSSSIPMVPGFSSHTTTAFTWLIGVGIEMDVSDHLRLGGLVRYSQLGNARLGMTPIQEGPQTLHNNSLHVNEFLLQLSYLG